jgi:HAD superfamily hydrolase (TIGR01459 family)
VSFVGARPCAIQITVPATPAPASVETCDHFRALAPRYDVVLCDVWGVVHDGVDAYAPACDALARYRAAGGTVVLITNAPRPSPWVIRQLDRLGVPREAYDEVMTSGDLTREVVAGRGGPVFHIGPQRDITIFEGIDISFVPAEAAAYAVCSGLFDDTKETPEDYRTLLAGMRERELLMVCANPDLVVARGDALVYCAGAIAELYAAIGGEVLYAGKPHPPIYRAALAKAEDVRGTAPAAGRTLAIGDSLRTDIAGALALGIDGLFVSGGIHAAEFRDNPSGDALGRIFAAAGITPRAVTPRLAW